MASLTTSYDKQKFGEALLDQVREWIVEHFDPTELYGPEVIKQHVRDEYEPEDVYRDLES